MYTLTLDQIGAIFKISLFLFNCLRILYMHILCFDEVYLFPPLQLLPYPYTMIPYHVHSLSFYKNSWSPLTAQGYKATSWSKGARTLKKTDFPSLSSHQWLTTGGYLICYFYIALERSVNNLSESHFLTHEMEALWVGSVTCVCHTGPQAFCTACPK